MMVNIIRSEIELPIVFDKQICHTKTDTVTNYYISCCIAPTTGLNPDQLYIQGDR